MGRPRRHVHAVAPPEALTGHAGPRSLVHDAGAQAVQRDAQVDDHGAHDGSSGQGRRRRSGATADRRERARPRPNVRCRPRSGDRRRRCVAWGGRERVHRRHRRATLRAQVPRHPDAHHRAVGRAGRRCARRRGHRSATDVDGIVCAERHRRVAVVRARDHRRVLRVRGELRRARRPRRRVGGRHGVAGRGGRRARASARWWCARGRATPSPSARRPSRPTLGPCTARVEPGWGRPRPSSRSRTATSRRTRLRDDRPALRRGAVRLRTSADDREDRGRPAHERVRQPGGDLLRPADHGRRRARISRSSPTRSTCSRS